MPPVEPLKLANTAYFHNVRCRSQVNFHFTLPLGGSECEERAVGEVRAVMISVFRPPSPPSSNEPKRVRAWGRRAGDEGAKTEG